MTIMFPFNNVFKHATVCLYSIYYEDWSKSDIPTAHWSRSPTVRQFDSPTEMCLFITFIVRVRTAAKWTLYGGIFIHLGKEIVNFFNSMTFSKWRPYEFRGGYIWIKLNLFVFFAVKLPFLWQSRCSRQFVPDWKDCLS